MFMQIVMANKYFKYNNRYESVADTLFLFYEYPKVTNGISYIR